MKRKVYLLASAGLMLSGCVPMAGISSGGGPVTVTGMDDPQQGQVQVSSLKFAQPLLGSTTLNTADPYLYGVYDKGTQQVRRIELHITANSSSQHDWSTVSFPDYPELLPIDLQRNHEQRNCSVTDDNCSYVAELTGHLDLKQVNWMAAQNQPINLYVNSTSSPPLVLKTKLIPLEAQTFLQTLENLSP